MGTSQGDGDKAEAPKPPATESTLTPDNAASAENGSATPASINASGSDLPVVESPKLDADDASVSPDEEIGREASTRTRRASSALEVVHEMPRGSADEPAAASPRARSSRLMMLTASIAVAAALGSFAGSLAATGVMKFEPASAANPSLADASAVMRAMKSQLAELATIKSNLDGATRNTNAQFAKIAERFDRVEHAQADPAAKLTHIADAVDRLDKHSMSAPETTGSITAAASAASEPKSPDRILEGWIVQDVEGGRALVANRGGAVFDIGTGSFLPGVGRIDGIKRQDGQWIVLTSRGTITSGR